MSVISTRLGVEESSENGGYSYQSVTARLPRTQTTILAG